MQQLMHKLAVPLFLIVSLVSGWSSPAQARQSLVLSINEGTSGSSEFLTMQDKYRPLADHLAKRLQLPVKLESATTLKLVQLGLQKKKFDLLLVRPAHMVAKGMRDYQYQLAVAAEGESVAHFIVMQKSPLKSIRDLKGKRVALPDPDAYPTHIGLAMLRQAGINPTADSIAQSRSQEAVGYAVQQGFVDAGVVINYSKVYKNWAKEGGRVLASSPTLPFWGILAHPDMPAETLTQIRQALTDLKNSEEGRTILKQIGISGFTEGNPENYANMLKFLGE